MVILATVLIIQRTIFGFEFPIPWNDETSFIAQALSLSKENTLYSWGLNQESTVMWMPPGYMIILSVFYKIFGYSFELTRWISSGLYILSILIILKIAKDEIGKNILLYLVSLFLILSVFLSQYSLVIANIARMESLYFLTFSLSLLFAIKKYPVIALAIIISSATIHYNAVYFLLPIGSFIIWSIITRKNITIRPIELIALILSALVVLAYLILVFKNINSFLQDMHFQFEWKKMGAVMSGSKGWITLGLLSVIPLGIIINYRDFNTSTWLASYGISFIAMALNGHNMWYSFAFQTGYLLIILSLILIIKESTKKAKIHFAVIICIPLLIQQFNHAWGYHDQFSPMLKLIKSPSQSFLSEETLKKAKQEILELPSGSVISFGYTGIDPFFFNELDKAELKWSISGNSVTQLHPLRKLDYRMHCDSALYPAYLFVYDWDGYARKGEDTGCEIIDLRVKVNTEE